MRVGEELTSSGLRLNLDAWLLRVQEDALVHAGWLKSLAGGDALAPVAAADARAEVRLRAAGEAMLGKPLSPQTLVDEEKAQHRQADAPVAAQHASLARAERYGRRSGLASRSLLLVATAGALMTLAGALDARRAAWLALDTGALLLCLALATGVLALVA